MDKNRRAEIIQAVEWHDRDLLSEISELQAERDQAIREVARIGRELGKCSFERDRLKARVAELEADKTSLAEQSNRFRRQRQRLREALEFIVKEWKKGSYSPEWFLNQKEVKAALRLEVDGGKSQNS